MTQVLERVLNLRRADFGRAGLLFLYLFLVITTYLAGRVARDALFLDQFRASQLPFLDISIAVLVGFVVAGYMRAGRKLPPDSVYRQPSVLCRQQLWILVSQPLLPPALAISGFLYLGGIFGVICPAQVWTLANYVLTTREAKRLFGVIGAGGIVGG